MMTPEGDMDGFIENVSAGGAYIRCGTLLVQHDLFLLLILHHDREYSWIGAKVVWIDISLSSNGNGDIVPVGMGVRFTDITADDRRFLREVVSKHSSC
jgi:Tfp pilus assembly protein PilZ